MTNEMLFVSLLLAGLAMTIISAITTSFAIKYGFRSQRGNTLTGFSIATILLGPLFTIGSIDQLVEGHGAQGWVGVVSVLVYVLGLVGAFAVAIRAGTR